MAEEKEYVDDFDMQEGSKGFKGGVAFLTDKTKLKRSFDKVPTVTVNKCPWCGGLDSIVDGRCQMPGCGRPVIYKGPRPRDEPALTPEEVEIIAAQKGAEMEQITSMGPLPGDIKGMRAEINRRKDAIRAAMAAARPAPAGGARPPRRHRGEPVALPEGPVDTSGDF